MVELRAWRIAPDPDDLLRHGSDSGVPLVGHGLAVVGLERVSVKRRRKRPRQLTAGELEAVAEAKRQALVWDL